MKHSFFVAALGLFLVLAGGAFAASLGPSEKLRAGEVLRGRFEEDHPVKKLGQVVHSTGRFTVVPERGVLWIIEKPFPITVVVTPKGMVQSVGGIPVLRFSTGKVPFLGEATDLLTAALQGDIKSLEPRFKIAESGRAKAWKLVLTPRNKAGEQMPFETITAKGGRYVDGAKVQRLDGLDDQFTFSAQSITKGALADDENLLFEAAEADPQR